MSVEPYIKGVERGIAEDAIRFYPRKADEPWGPDDSFSHLPEKKETHKIHNTNTRSLATIGQDCLRVFEGMKRNMLFFGPGAGKEVSDARRMCETAHIESVSCTPIHPNLSVEEEALDMRYLFSAEGTKVGIDELTPDYILRMQQEVGLQLLQHVPHPVVNIQHIGLLQKSMRDILTAGKFSFMYDNLGPLYYTMKSDDKFRRKRELMRRVVDSLTPDGLLVVSSGSVYARDHVEAASTPDDCIVHVNSNGPIILAKPESFLKNRIHEKGYQTHNRILEITERNWWMLDALGLRIEV